MNKVLIDVTALSDQYKYRGIGNYTKELVTRIIKNSDFEWHLIGFEDLKKQEWINKINYHSIGKVQLSSPRNLFRFIKNYLPILKSVNPKIYFAPHFERGLPFGRFKTIVSLHDIIPLVSNTYSAKGIASNFIKGIFYKYNLK